MKELVGKTIAKVEFKDPWDEGLKIVFTDGTELQVHEGTQSGEIKVLLDGKKCGSLHKFQA